MQFKIRNHQSQENYTLIVNRESKKLKFEKINLKLNLRRLEYCVVLEP